MKKLGIILLSLIVLLMSLSLADVWHFGSLRKRAMSLKTGDTKADVRRALGCPTGIFTPPPEARTNIAAWLLRTYP
jgi:hypothetical protein